MVVKVLRVQIGNQPSDLPATCKFLQGANSGPKAFGERCQQTLSFLKPWGEKEIFYGSKKDRGVRDSEASG